MMWQVFYRITKIGNFPGTKWEAIDAGVRRLEDRGIIVSRKSVTAIPVGKVWKKVKKNEPDLFTDPCLRGDDLKIVTSCDTDLTLGNHRGSAPEINATPMRGGWYA
jgi:hypothetical protein